MFYINRDLKLCEKKDVNTLVVNIAINEQDMIISASTLCHYFEEDFIKIVNKRWGKKGRPKKVQEEVRNVAIPVALKQIEKDWIEQQALNMSKEVGVKITTSAWMRMTLLKEMKKDL